MYTHTQSERNRRLDTWLPQQEGERFKEGGFAALSVSVQGWTCVRTTEIAWTELQGFRDERLSEVERDGTSATCVTVMTQPMRQLSERWLWEEALLHEGARESPRHARLCFSRSVADTLQTALLCCRNVPARPS